MPLKYLIFTIRYRQTRNTEFFFFNKILFNDAIRITEHASTGGMTVNSKSLQTKW
jgi:hypothetical protein